MAHSRARNDTEEYRQSLLESTGPSRYLLNRPRANGRDGCVTADPRASSQGYPVARCESIPLVDVDSDLLGITRRYGLCDSAKYDPRRDGSKCKPKPSQCSANYVSDLDAEDCRISNPPCTLRGTGINRFEWLCRDPQEGALGPFALPVEDRRLAKDNHRPLIESPLLDGVQPPAPASGYTPGAGSVDVGIDIETAVAGYPGLLRMQHWRDAGEVERIYGCPRR